MSVKHWINKNYKNIIIAAFIIPIITVALVSISHVMHWYAISNTASWAVYLSVGIEIAAMSALAAIAARMGKKVYFPFIIVTLIQFIGNIYYSYAFIDVTSAAFISWKELVSPILQLTGVDSTDLMAHKRFLAFFAGGLLPIISLSFLHMLIRFTEEDRLRDKEIENTTPPVVALENETEPLTDYDLHKIYYDGSNEEPNWPSYDDMEQEAISETKIEEKNNVQEIIDTPVEPVEKKTEIVTEHQEIEIPREVIEDATRVKLNDYELEVLENKLASIPFVEKEVPEAVTTEETPEKEVDITSTEEKIEPLKNVYLYDGKLVYKDEDAPLGEPLTVSKAVEISEEPIMPELTYEEEKQAFMDMSRQTMTGFVERELAKESIVSTEPEPVNTEPESDYATEYIAGIDPITEEPEITIMKVDPETQVLEQIIPKIDEDLKKKV